MITYITFLHPSPSSLLLLFFLIHLLQILLKLVLRVVLQLILILIEYLCTIKYSTRLGPIQLDALVGLQLPSPPLLPLRVVLDLCGVSHYHLLLGDRVFSSDELLVEAEEDVDEVVVPDVDGVEELFEGGRDLVVYEVEDQHPLGSEEFLEVGQELWGEEDGWG